MKTEVSQTETVGNSIADNGRCRLRQQDLSAVGRGRYPCRLVHLHSDVITISVLRFSDMQTHPDPQIDALRPRRARQSCLGHGCRLKGLHRT